MKMLIKRFAAALCVAALLLVGIPYQISTKADGMMTASQEVAAINVGWNLGNTLDSYGTWITNVNPTSVETAWGNPLTTRELILSVQQQGFNAIRIPVTWAQFTDSEGNVDSAWMNRVHEVVDYAYNAGMYVILNVHHDTGEHGSDKVCWMIADMNTYEQTRDRFEGLWTSIANEFRDYGDHLMFEGYNELLDMNNSWNSSTTGTTAYDATNSYAQLFVDTVRSTGGNNATRNLIVNTYVCSVEQVVRDNFVLPSDTVPDHLICEVHCYSPWWFSTATDTSDTTFTEQHRSDVITLMNTISNFSEQLGVPVIIGEFGPEYKNNDDQRAAYIECYISEATSRGIKCFWWDNGDYRTGSEFGGYAIVNRNNLTWRTPLVEALVNNSQGEPISVIEEISVETQEVETTVESTVETTQITETTIAETNPTQTDINSLENVNNTNDSTGVLLVVGCAVVLGAYVGLFILGRKNGFKKNK
ncbi:MAG: glycoside hydrolase family 5 protein [Saccharofermentans sp.]|nr:glycoside hydrolase family 5 protein [Saccharofermentans sp.]